MKPIYPIFLGLASLAYAQTSVTLDGASGSQTFNLPRSTAGGLTLGLGFEVEYLVIGGGGAGGGAYDYGPGGGGAGGMLSGSLFLTNESVNVTVGTGGTAALALSGGNGGNSVFASITANGGGGGGGRSENGFDGASGGGAGGRPVSSANRIGGTAIAGQGNAGGNNVWDRGGGGGGGAGGAGGTSANDSGGAGGAGLASSISGTAITYSLGGTGGSDAAISNGVAGTVNRGNGGSGAAANAADTDRTGGVGGSGIVIARYKGASAGTGGSVAAGTGTAAGYRLHTFTATGASALDLSGLDLSTRLGAVENGVISGSGDLTFTGPGTLTLNATNTYSGITRVNAGTLALGSSGSIGTSAGVSLASGARFNVSTVSGGFNLGATQTLSGGGTIAGNTTISGTHTPGFSPGVQTFENNLSYTAGSSVVWELIDDSLAGRGTNYDGIDVGGNLSFSGATTLTLDFDLAGSAVDWSDSLWSSNITGNTGWKIYAVTGTISGFQNLQLASINWLDGQGDAFKSARPDASFSLFQGTDGIYLNYSAVPEPSAALLGGLGMLALLRRRR
jgi:autotransporter-associated beta strand protein